jgi:hypothetical protein
MIAPPFEPLAFELTADEARIAASRAGLRRALAGGLTKRHLAPLAAFTLALLFTAILTLTGLAERRHGEIALLLSTAAYMVYRLWTRRQFLAARRESARAIEAFRAAGAVVVAIDETGVTLSAPASSARWRFPDVEAEDAGGMVYLWPREGLPAVLPARVFPSPEAATAFVAFARSRTRDALSRSRP